MYTKFGALLVRVTLSLLVVDHVQSSVQPADIDGPQEMERNEATAKHVAWPSCAWLQFSFFSFPVGMSAGCTLSV